MTSLYILQTYTHAHNCRLGTVPPVGLGFRLGLELGENFPSGAIFLEPFKLYKNFFGYVCYVSHRKVTFKNST